MNLTAILAYIGQLAQQKASPILMQALSHYAVPALMYLGADSGVINGWVAATAALAVSVLMHLAHFQGTQSAAATPLQVYDPGNASAPLPNAAAPAAAVASPATSAKQ